MNSELLSASLIVLAGLAGGFANALLAGPLRRARRLTLPDGTVGFDLGWIGNVLIGGMGAFAFWGLGLSNPSSPAVYATGVLTGLGGARILNDLLEKKVLGATATGLAAELTETIGG